MHPISGFSFVLVCFLITAAKTNCQAQDAEGTQRIETDRDSFTPAITTVDKQRLMVESAWSYTDNKRVADAHSLPELLLRYGLTRNLEVRFGANYETGGESSVVSSGGSFLEGASEGELGSESKVTYGVKMLLNEQDGWRPQSALTVAGATPTGGEENATSLISSYVFGWEFENRINIASGMRYGLLSAEEDHFNSWAPSTVIKVPVFERVSVHAEYFGIFSDGRDVESVRHFFSPGVSYLVSPDLEIGLRTGWGLNDQSANFFSNVGFGWQY